MNTTTTDDSVFVDFYLTKSTLFNESIDNQLARNNRLFISMILIIYSFEIMLVAKKIKKDIESFPGDVLCDPEESLYHKLIKLQKRLREQQDKLPNTLKLPRWFMRQAHRQVGKARVLLAHHDYPLKPHHYEINKDNAISLDTLINQIKT